MREKQKAGRWPSQQRLEFIDYRLYWEGHVNRGDIVEYYGVSVPQASADLTQYQEAAPGNAVYDKTLKTYVAGPSFKAVFFQPSADQYLSQLRLIASGLLPTEEAWAVRMPSYSIVPILRRRLEPDTLRTVLRAIRDGLAIHVHYQSMSGTEPKWRWLAPHSLGFDGGRWHARAWCYGREKFLDFVLSRVVGIGDTRRAEIDPSEDVGWQREITLKLGPHPALKDGKRRAIELDYGMTKGVLEVPMRACLANYFMIQFGLDRKLSEVKPERQQIVLLNRDEVEAVMKETGTCGPSDSGES